MAEFKLRIIHDRRNCIKKGIRDVAPVEIEVGMVGSSHRTFISTNVTLSKRDFKCGYPLKLRKTNLSKTQELMISETHAKVLKFTNSSSCNSIKDVQNWNKNGLEQINLLNFIESYIENLSVKEDTKKNYWSMFTRLKEFGKINSFQDLTFKNITAFDSHLRKTIMSIETLRKRHNMLKQIINEAIKLDHIEESPYNKFDIPKGNNSKTPVVLTESEIKLIEEYQPSTRSLIQCKEMFLFQYYTGLAFVDMQAINKRSFETINGKEVIRTNRHKTDSYFVVPVSTAAQRILEMNNYEFTKIELQSYNKNIKTLALRVGIDKNVTSHTARHRKNYYDLSVN